MVVVDATIAVVVEDVADLSAPALAKMHFVLVADYPTSITIVLFRLVSTICAYIHIHFSCYENITKYIQSQQILNC